MKMVTLLMNARARSEAMNRMDRGDYGGAQMAMAAAAMDNEILFSRLPNDRDLREEIDDLNDVQLSLSIRESDTMTRKRMAYRRESIRKNK